MAKALSSSFEWRHFLLFLPSQANMVKRSFGPWDYLSSSAVTTNSKLIKRIKHSLYPGIQTSCDYVGFIKMMKTVSPHTVTHTNIALILKLLHYTSYRNHALEQFITPILIGFDFET
ncbi:hypothetical protein CHARACLAT_005628 [Characodon lateralis]|uniref:Uncharacterized protein n=1 Tax=Characodon lateralis TaxID=208331 RepID=A0ABU7DXY8_9TELE|nr:hypothetical protein [Characodon lateralis]